MNPDHMKVFVAAGKEVASSTYELLAHVEQTFGLFCDSHRGWKSLSQVLEGLVRKEVERGLSREKVLLSTVVHGKGEPSAGVALHRSTLGERISMCQEGGPNEVALGNMCLTSIYGFWESRTRPRIAQACKIELDAVRSDLFGDIRRFRHLILHCDGVADNSVAQSKVLKWFSPGQKIVIDADKLHQLVVEIRKFPNGLVTKGFDPQGL